MNNAPTTDQSRQGASRNQQFDNTINSGSSWPVAQLPYHSATPDLAKIKSVWKLILLSKDSVIELRAFHYRDKTKVQRQIFCASDFSTTDEMKQAFERKALFWNTQGYNIYVTLNPIKSDFKGNSARDTDIASRNLMLIDIDRTRDTTQPATDTDIANAKALAEKIMRFLDAQGWTKPFQVMSGNGWHLYYVLNRLDNNDENTDVIRSTLNTLAKRFNNDDVSVDTTVFNASRITKVPGTVMRKGEESSDRPYRRAVFSE